MVDDGGKGFVCTFSWTVFSSRSISLVFLNSARAMGLVDLDTLVAANGVNLVCSFLNARPLGLVVDCVLLRLNCCLMDSISLSCTT